jgi:hypothetical protein
MVLERQRKNNMAQKLSVEVVDDIDGGAASQTVPFGLDGVSYDIDLSDENAAHLRDELARFVAAARRTGGRKIRQAAGESSAPAKENAAQIRVWARSNGYSISDRGRVSKEISEAYELAQAEPVEQAPVKAAHKRSPRKKALGSA